MRYSPGTTYLTPRHVLTQNSNRQYTAGGSRGNVTDTGDGSSSIMGVSVAFLPFGAVEGASGSAYLPRFYRHPRYSVAMELATPSSSVF